MENNNRTSKGAYKTPEGTKHPAESLAACLGGLADVAPIVNRIGNGKVIIKISNVHDSFNDNGNGTIRGLIDILAEKDRQINTLLSIIAEQSKPDKGLNKDKGAIEKAMTTIKAAGPEGAEKAASAVNDYLGEYADHVTDLLKLLHLNRAIAKKTILYAEPYLKREEVERFENTYTEYATQLENVIKSTFSDALIDINADRLTAI